MDSCDCFNNNEKSYLNKKYVNYDHFQTRKFYEESLDLRLLMFGQVEYENKELKHSKTQTKLYYLGMAASLVTTGLGLYLLRESGYTDTLSFAVLLSGIGGMRFNYNTAESEDNKAKAHKENLDKIKEDIFRYSRN